LQLPDSYAATHDVFNRPDLRPWFQLADRVPAVEYPEVQGHPALNEIVQVLDRTGCGLSRDRFAT